MRSCILFKKYLVIEGIISCVDNFVFFNKCIWGRRILLFEWWYIWFNFVCVECNEVKCKVKYS